MVEIEVIEPEAVKGPTPSREFLPLLADNLEKYADRQTTGRVFKYVSPEDDSLLGEDEEGGVVKMCVLGVAFITASQCRTPEFDVESWLMTAFDEGGNPERDMVDTDEAISAISEFLPYTMRGDLSLEIEKLDPRFGLYKEIIDAPYPHVPPFEEYTRMDLYVLNDDWKINFKTMAQAVRNYAAKRQAA